MEILLRRIGRNIHLIPRSNVFLALTLTGFVFYYIMRNVFQFMMPLSPS